MNEILVNPSGLQSAAPLYGDQAAGLADIYNTLTARLSAEGDCWGNDDAGKAFAAKYVRPALKALQQMADACQGLESTSTGIYRWAQNYVTADEAAKADLTTQLGY